MALMRTKLTHAGSAALAAASLTTIAALGCGGGGATGAGGASSGAGGSTSSGTGTSGAGGSKAIACPGQPAELALGGTWAAYGQLSVKLQGAAGGAITICPTDQVGAATLLVLMTVTPNAADPTKLDAVHATLCSVDLPTVTALVGTCNPGSPSLVTTQIITPKAVIDALPKVVTQPATGTVSGKSVGATVVLGPLDVTVGSSKSAPDLPRWDTTTPSCNAADLGHNNACATTCVSDCASLRDDDQDSFPGVTMQVCGYTADDTKKGVMCHADMPGVQGATLQGKAFLDIEVNPTLHGTVKSSCEIIGTVDSKVLYNIVGADLRLVGQALAVSSAIKSLPTFQVDPQASKLRMVRIDGQYGAPDWKVDPTQPSAACATLNMRVNEL